MGLLVCQKQFLVVEEQYLDSEIFGVFKAERVGVCLVDLCDAENDSILWSGQEGKIIGLNNGMPVISLTPKSNLRDVFISSLLADSKNIIAGTLGNGLSG